MILSVLTGTMIGTAAGTVPGLHTNNIAPLFLATPFVNPELTVFTAAAAMGFTVSSHIPSVLLGAPSGENISVLPGHKLTREGEGTTAVYLALKGSFIATLLIPAIALAFLTLAPPIYPVLSILMPFLLIAITLIMIRKPSDAIITALSALLGLIALEGKTIMPLLTGFFGTSTLIVALLNRTQVPKQVKEPEPRTESWKTTRAATLSTVLSSFFGAIPAVSSSITALTGKALGKMNKEEYISFIGASNTTYVTIAFLALLTINKTRSGATAAIAATKFPTNPLPIILTLMTAASISYLLIKINLGRIAGFMNRFNPWKLNLTALIFLVALNLFLTTPRGIMVLITSTAIGITAVYTKASRINCIASLTIPTALLFI